ncbi:MAG: cupin-like domain-containing protein, partial [Porticoccaceae bacterium]
HVEALDEFNALVNYWWRSSPNYLGTPLNVLQHALMSLRDLPPEQRAIWQNLFEHYIFNAKEENFAHIPESARGVLNTMDEKTAENIRGLLISRLQR